EAIGELAIAVGKRDQLLAEHRTIAQPKGAHGTDDVAALAGLDAACGDCRVPFGMTVEVAQKPPDLINRRIDHRAPRQLDEPIHRRAKRACRAFNPTRKTLRPISATSSASLSLRQSNSALHSAKLRSPSVTGNSRKVAI